MPYLFLLAAIALEIAGTLCLKLSNGFENPVPTGLAFLCCGLMNVPLILALKHLDLSLVYATWAGIGVVAAVALGVFWFGEAATPQRIGLSLLVIVGVIGLNANLAG